MRRSGAEATAPSLTSDPFLLRRQILFLLLGLAFVRGLLYMAVFPPWQHYDEPTHFEYIRLIAERGRIPGPDDYDLVMRREIAASMQATDFWRGLDTPVISFWSDTPPEIGASELQHPPFYYILQALPQLLVAHQDVETQLYVARLGSILLTLIVIASAYGVLSEIMPRRQWTPVVVAGMIALLPAFTDLMSGVNNDAGAAAGISLLLWAGVRLIRRGPSLGRVALIVLLAGICAVTKSTAGVVALAVLLTLGLGYLSAGRRRWVWGGLALSILVALAATFTWGGDAAYWVSDLQPAAPNRVTDQGFLGQAAFVLSAGDSRHSSSIFQELASSKQPGLRGHTVTFGAWVKAPEGAEGTFSLRLDDGFDGAWHRVQVTTDWQFQVFTTTVRLDAPGLAAYAFLPNRQDAAKKVYVDGLVLVDGDMPTRQAPQFDTAEATTGQWGTRRIVNLLKNGSAEDVWPGLRTWIGSRHMYRQPIALAFYSLWDLSRTAWVYVPEISFLMASFWGRFGWNQLALPTTYLALLRVVTGLSIIGVGIGLARRFRLNVKIEPWQRRAWSMMAVTLVVAWGAAILRIHPVLITRHVFWPGARYASVAIVPTATLLCLGLAEIVPRRLMRQAVWLGLLGLTALDTVALLTIVLPYYYG